MTEDTRDFQKQLNDNIRALRRRIGANIHTQRSLRRMKLEELSALSGLEPPVLDRFEIGGGEIRLDHVMRVAIALRIEAGILLA